MLFQLSINNTIFLFCYYQFIRGWLLESRIVVSQMVGSALHQAGTETTVQSVHALTSLDTDG